MASAEGTSDRLLLGACLLALGVLAWVCVLGHARALAATPKGESIPVTAASGLPPAPVEVRPEPPAPAPAVSPASVRVQAALDRLLSNGRIDFETGTNRLAPTSTPVLDAVAALLASEPALNVEVEGHTDGRGNPAANRRLSLRRAQAVQAYLAARGIDAARVYTVGSGSTRPLVRAHTPEAFELNRRIEFRVLAPGSR